MNSVIYCEQNWDTFVHHILKLVIKSSSTAIKNRGRFRVVITGGETSKLIYKKLINIKTDWSKWEFWLSDERCVPNNHSLSNEFMIKENFLKFLNIDKSQIHFMNGSIGPFLGAEEYKKQIDRNSIFDLTILSIGEDGHVASLFPGNEMGSNSEDPEVLPIFNSPKPPFERISLSLRSINKSSVIIIIATGINKKHVIDNFLNELDMPALHVKGMEATYLLYCQNPQIL